MSVEFLFFFGIWKLLTKRLLLVIKHAPPTGAVTVQIRGSREARVDSQHLDVLVVVNGD